MCLGIEQWLLHQLQVHSLDYCDIRRTRKTQHQDLSGHIPCILVGTTRVSQECGQIRENTDQEWVAGSSFRLQQVRNLYIVFEKVGCITFYQQFHPNDSEQNKIDWRVGCANLLNCKDAFFCSCRTKRSTS